MKTDNAHIDLIISACGKVSQYIQGFSKENFLNDEKTQSAVIMQLQVIGEMAKKLDEKTKNAVDTPWKMIVGLRNIISHDYFILKLEDVWKIASTDAPPLEEKLRAYLKKEGTEYIPPFEDTTPLMD